MAPGSGEGPCPWEQGQSWAALGSGDCWGRSREAEGRSSLESREALSPHQRVSWERCGGLASRSLGSERGSPAPEVVEDMEGNEITCRGVGGGREKGHGGSPTSSHPAQNSPWARPSQPR